MPAETPPAGGELKIMQQESNASVETINAEMVQRNTKFT
uniref:Uncharacterized protein n=1 Tax=Rhizophora mucronata TaxID=61149 RepID=A0A2P2N7T3_RHIMU